MASSKLKPDCADFSCVLLAGGRSQRMGRNKAFLPMNGTTLWQHQWRLLESLNPAEMWIVAPPHPAWKNCPRLDDALPDSGPLGALVSALRAISTRRVLVMAVDMPRMNLDFLRRLIDRNGCTVPEIAGRAEPLCAVYPKNALALAEGKLAQRDLSLQHFVTLLRSRSLIDTWPITAADQGIFHNVNSPSDWLAFSATPASPQPSR